MAKQKNEKSGAVDEGIISVRFGRPGTPDRDALEELEKIGAEAKPAPAARNQMIRVAVREYVERYKAPRKSRK